MLFLCFGSCVGVGVGSLSYSVTTVSISFFAKTFKVWAKRCLNWNMDHLKCACYDYSLLNVLKYNYVLGASWLRSDGSWVQVQICILSLSLVIKLWFLIWSPHILWCTRSSIMWLSGTDLRQVGCLLLFLGFIKRLCVVILYRLFIFIWYLETQGRPGIPSISRCIPATCLCLS